MKAVRLSMSNRDVYRATVMRMVNEGRHTLGEAAVKIGLSYRQAKRIYRRYRAEGDGAVIHRSVGRPSHRRISEEIRKEAVRHYREQYADFGPTLASEKLRARDGIMVDHETLRRWLIEDGLWQVKHRRRRYRARRERRERFGELVQFDGSHHEWFEDRGESCCLMNMVDDATGTTFSMLFEAETTEAAMRLLWEWIKRYGIPQAVYCDRKNAFVLDREPTISEQLAGVEPRSPFELACEKLGIEVIVARSPQAKGRVERNHGVYQDRFVKELRLENISSIDEANRFLQQRYLADINERFAKPAIEPEDAHVALVDPDELNNVFCFEQQRVVSNDYVVQHEGRLYQLVKQPRKRLPEPATRVTVRRWLDGSVHIFWQKKELTVREIIQRPKKEEPAEERSA